MYVVYQVRITCVNITLHIKGLPFLYGTVMFAFTHKHTKNGNVMFYYTYIICYYNIFMYDNGCMRIMYFRLL